MSMQSSEVLFNSFLKSAENIITHFDDDKEERDKMLSKLKDIVQTNCKYDAKTKKINETVRYMGDHTALTSPDEVFKAFQDKKQDLLDYDPDVTNDANLKNFEGQAQSLIDHADGTAQKNLDDDIEMTQDTISVIDPFTKKRMTDPVKNKSCGHVYDKESLILYLQNDKFASSKKDSIYRKKNVARCPVVGCMSKEPLSMENVCPDLITRRYLQEHKE